MQEQDEELGKISRQLSDSALDLEINQDQPFRVSDPLIRVNIGSDESGNKFSITKHGSNIQFIDDKVTRKSTNEALNSKKSDQSYNPLIPRSMVILPRTATAAVMDSNVNKQGSFAMSNAKTKRRYQYAASQKSNNKN